MKEVPNYSADDIKDAHRILTNAPWDDIKLAVPVSDDHMTDLDEKLQAILEPWKDEIVSEYGTGINDDKKPPFVALDGAIPAIKQAFVDAGFIQVPQVLKDTGETLIIMTQNQRSDMLKQAGYMTGKEWYDRFKLELMDIPVLWNEEIPKQLNPYALKVLEAAKKASGIE